MDKILEDTLAQQKPDPAFEQRMLAGFRNRIPERSGLVKLLSDLMRLRAAQITAVAAVLLGLVQLGRIITGETATTPRTRDRYANEQLFKQPAQVASVSEPGRAGALEKTDELADGKSKDLALAAPQSSVETRSKLQKDLKPFPATVVPAKAAQAEMAAKETGSEANVMNYAAEPSSAETPVPELANRKLIRNATAQLEIISFDDAVQKITAFANEERGYVATTSSEKQANGKLRGEVIVKVLPENLDRFLQKLRGLGELKNQTLGTEDVTKAYFDTDARLKNAHVMEQRLIDMLKTKTGKVSDLLQVEKELGRVREEIEKMQGELKYWDSQVQFATVTVSLAEKDLEEPAAFLLKERSQLALYAPDVEKIYNDIKAPRISKDSDHERAVEPRLLGTRLCDNEHVDRAGRKRKRDQPRQRFWTRREFSNADGTYRAGRQRHVGKCKDQTRQGGIQHQHLARGTGASLAADQSAHSHLVSGRKGKGAPRPCRETERTCSQFDV